MAKYGYEAINKLGKELKGTVEAGNEEEARSKLKGQGLTVVTIKTQNFLTQDINIQIGGYPTTRDLSVMCRQFVSMNKAGVTIMETLRMLYEQTENQRLKDALKEVRIGIEKGDTLAQALADHPKVFPDLMVNMVAAGEASGTLHIALERVSTQLERSSKTKALVKKAMIYPVVVLVVAVIVVIILMAKVIPSFQEIFDMLEGKLPLPTRIVIAVSDFVVANLVWVIGGIIAVIALIAYAKNTESGKQLSSRMCLKIPIIKDFSIKNASAKFSMTMSTLVMSGVPLVEALGIVANVVENRVVRKVLNDAREDVMQGIPMSEPIEASGVFPMMVHHMLRIGEETGNVEQMLEKVAVYYEDEVEVATKNLTTAMEPAVICLLAVVVGGIVGAIVMPMMQIYSMAG